MTALTLFHGTTAPPRRWASTVTGDVVLQPFHPLIRQGGFEEWFPRARRWVYTNPTTVDPLRQADAPSHLVARDPEDRWQLPRLRLPDGLKVALDDAAALAGLPGVHGLFVDDLDRLITHGDDVTSDYLSGLARSTRCPVFANRGFQVLDDIERLEAVLLESFADDLAKPDAHAWAQSVAVPALASARDAGCRLHRLEYRPVGRRRLSATARLLDRSVTLMCDSTHLAATEDLNDWREWA